MLPQPLILNRVWRSQFLLLILVGITSVLAVVLSRRMPSSVIYGELFQWGDSRIMLWLPLWWFVPCGLALLCIARIYDVHYVLDNRGIIATEGILQLQQRITRVEFLDIRSVEMSQTLWERFLNIGNVEVGTAASSNMEMKLTGIADPLSTKILIQECRDKVGAEHPQFNSQVAA